MENDYLTIAQFANKYTAFSEAALRCLKFKADRNKSELSKAFKRLDNGRIYINVQLFFANFK